MRNIKTIIERKKNNSDCTEQESARIKYLIKKLSKLFPNEFDEATLEIQSEKLRARLDELALY